MDIKITEGQEQEKVAKAHSLYSELQGFRGKASLDGYFSGEVIFPDDPPRRIEVYRLPVTEEFEKKLMTDRGFTDSDIQSGMITLIEKEFNNPNWPGGKFKPEKQLAYYNVSGSGRVVVDYYPEQDKYEETKLEDRHLEALKTVFRLSQIPGEILSEFGSYDNFVKLVGKDYKYVGIDTAEFTPTGILYNGSLRSFTEALAKRNSGEAVRLPSHMHSLQSSLDDRGHFEQMIDTLKNGSED